MKTCKHENTIERNNGKLKYCLDCDSEFKDGRWKKIKIYKNKRK